MNIARSAIVILSMVLTSLLLGCSSAEYSDFTGYKDPEPARFHAGSTSIAENPLADDSTGTSDDSVSGVRVIETVLWTIDAYKVECQGFILSQCYLIQSADMSDAEYFYDHIHGFDYEWGYSYEILVDVSQRDNSSGNQSKHYSLNSIVSKSEYKKDSTFDYVIRYGEFSVENIADGQYQLPGGPIFTCDSTRCADLEDVLLQDKSAVIVFELGETTHDPLQLHSVACSSEFESFDAVCL